LPHSRSINEEKGIEEERRLVYVGMTRARKTLTLTRAVYRRVFGNEQQMRASLPSRFLAEIPSELVETVRGSMAEIGETRRYEPDRNIRTARRSLPGGYEGFQHRRLRAPQRRAAAATTSFLWAVGDEARRAGRSDAWAQGAASGVWRGGQWWALRAEDDDRRVSVSFPGRGTKKFVERYAQLQQV